MHWSDTVKPREGWFPEDLDAFRREVEAEEWYHTFELAPGVTTPGWLDLRPVVHLVPFPPDLAGNRCLDIGTFDGFWAFEMEARGGEVLAIDVLDPVRWDWPGDATEETIAALNRRKRSGAGFELAARVFGSNVEHRQLSIYDLDPDEVGTFDLVYLGSLLLHLRDPVGALMAVRKVTEGTLIVCDAIDPLGSLISRPMATLDARGRPWWWRPNLAALERMVDAAGFTRTQPSGRVRIPAGLGRTKPPISLSVLRSQAARRELFDVRRGDPHAIVVAE